MAETTTDKPRADRDRVYLKNGMGSVAAADYDEKVYGKAMDLTDEQYEQRLRGIIPGINVPSGTPSGAASAMAAAGVAGAPGKVTTTIAGLHTFDPATVPAPAPPTPPPSIAVAPVGKPVATTEPALEPGQIRVRRNGAETVIKEGEFNQATDTKLDTAASDTKADAKK